MVFVFIKQVVYNRKPINILIKNSLRKDAAMHKYGHYICLNSSIRARMRRKTKGIPSAKLLTGSSAKLLAAPLTLNYGYALQVSE